MEIGVKWKDLRLLWLVSHSVIEFTCIFELHDGISTRD